jgi:hypothetical protein
MKSKTTQGLGIKHLLSFPKHDSLKYWRLKSNANSHMSIRYVNQSQSLSWSFSDLSGGKWCLQRKYMCRQHETLDCRKLNAQVVIIKLISQKRLRTCVTTEWYPFVNRKMIKIATLIDLHNVLTYDCWHCFLDFNIWVSHVFEMTIKFYYPTLELFCFSFTQPFTHSKFWLVGTTCCESVGLINDNNLFQTCQ